MSTDKRQAPPLSGPTGTLVPDDDEPLPPEQGTVPQLAPELTAEVASPGERSGDDRIVPLAVLALIAVAGVAMWVLLTGEEEPQPKPATVTQQPPPPPRPPPPAPRVEPKKAASAGTPAEIELPPALPSGPPPPGMVKFITNPDTHVVVDGHDFGRQPVIVKLPAGRNTVVLQNTALQLHRVVYVDVKPAEETEQRFTFGKGLLRVAAPPKARLTLDGRPMASREVEVWEGNHRVEIVHSDKLGTRDNQIAVVIAGQTTGIYFEPPPEAR